MESFPDLSDHVLNQEKTATPRVMNLTSSNCVFRNMLSVRWLVVCFHLSSLQSRQLFMKCIASPCAAVVTEGFLR